MSRITFFPCRLQFIVYFRFYFISIYILKEWLSLLYSKLFHSRTYFFHILIYFTNKILNCYNMNSWTSFFLVGEYIEIEYFSHLIQSFSLTIHFIFFELHHTCSMQMDNNNNNNNKNRIFNISKLKYIFCRIFHSSISLNFFYKCSVFIHFRKIFWNELFFSFAS